MKKTLMMTSLLSTLMRSSIAMSPTDGEASQNGGAPAEASSGLDTEDKVAETIDPASASTDPVSADTIDPAVGAETDGDPEAKSIDAGVSTETEIEADDEPHQAISVLTEIETAVSNFGHELSAEFKSIMADLTAKAKALF